MSFETYVSFSFPLGPGVPKSNTESIGIHRPCSLAKGRKWRKSSTLPHRRLTLKRAADRVPSSMLKSAGRFLFQKQQNRRSKNNFPSKSLVDSIKSTIFAPTRTRQASSQCLNRRVVLFSYGTLFKDLHIARPVDGIATVARSPRRERHTDGELPPPHRLL